MVQLEVVRVDVDVAVQKPGEPLTVDPRTRWSDLYETTYDSRSYAQPRTFVSYQNTTAIHPNPDQSPLLPSQIYLSPPARPTHRSSA